MTVSGMPNVLFFLPEYSGATDCLIPVTQAQVDKMDQTIVNFHNIQKNMQNNLNML